MKPRSASFGLLLALLVVLLLFSLRFEFQRAKIDLQRDAADTSQISRKELRGIPGGMVASRSDFELKPLWDSSRSNGVVRKNNNALLAMAVGIAQKWNVDDIASKFVNESYSVILFHYDGNVDAWNDLDWTDKAIHIVARNQTKWWFAKRFLHPDLVDAYDYIFLWDEDLGVENFDPGRYVQIMAKEELEISQPALDPGLSSQIHHPITVRSKKKRVHRRVYYIGNTNCSSASREPPCTGWVEGMAPVFSRAAWRCVWNLIQNDLIHGWGLDMKLGYCAQGDPTKKVGVIDSEYIVHQGIPTLGGPSNTKVSRRSLDMRTHIRRQSTQELQQFNARWNRAVKLDAGWVNPFGT